MPNGATSGARRNSADASKAASAGAPVGSASSSRYCVSVYRHSTIADRYVGTFCGCAAPRAGQQRLPRRRLSANRPDSPRRIRCSARRASPADVLRLRQLEPERTMIVYHHSGCIDMAFLSWCDVYADGENFTSRLSRRSKTTIGSIRPTHSWPSRWDTILG